MSMFCIILLYECLCFVLSYFMDDFVGVLHYSILSHLLISLFVSSFLTPSPITNINLAAIDLNTYFHIAVKFICFL